EDGIRDFHVTGVQTCALPICHERYGRASPPSSPPEPRGDRTSPPTRPGPPPGSCARWTLGRTSLWDGTRDQPPGGSRGVRILLRSEERRVGKEGGAGGSGLE